MKYKKYDIYFHPEFESFYIIIEILSNCCIVKTALESCPYKLYRVDLPFNYFRKHLRKIGEL